MGGAAVVTVLGVVGFQVVADARERAAVARLAAVPGVLAPIGDGLPIRWQSDSLDRLEVAAVVDGVMIGPMTAEDGSQVLVATDLATGTVRWSTELYGPDPARTRSQSASGVSAPACVPTTDGADPAQIACLVSDGFTRYGDDLQEFPATTTFVQVVDTADGRKVARWDATGASLVVLDGVAVLASYAATDQAPPDGSVDIDARDLLTGDPRWTARTPALTRGLDMDQTLVPPRLSKVGDYVGLDQRDRATMLFDATGARVYEEELAVDRTHGPVAGGSVTGEPSSGRLLQDTYLGSGLSVTRVLGGDKPSFTYDGAPILTAVDDGSARGLLLFGADRSVQGDVVGGGVLHGVDVETGSVRWKTHIPIAGFSVALVARGRVVVATITGLAAVDARSGEQLWSVDAPKGWQFSYPMMDAHHVLVTATKVDDASHIDLVALDPTTGEQGWRTPLPEGVDYVYGVGDALLGSAQGTDGPEGLMRLG